MTRVLIVGATSAIAAACARLWAAQGASFYLVARDPAKLDQVADDLRVRGAGEVHAGVLDVRDLSSHAAVIAEGATVLGGIDVALVAHGTLPDQAACERDASLAIESFAVNATSVVSLLTLLSNRLEAQRGGTLAVITSVAGDRGRPTNYVYGCAKSAVSAFCEGLRARLFRAGVRVVDIRPGFVESPMTSGLALPRPLVSSPEAVAARIVPGIARGVDVLYVPRYWSLIMFVIRHVPSMLFKRVRL